jgi:uncharacterized hydrophobic protein (TIGR00271 family)
MRLIQLLVPTDQRETVEDVLSDRDIEVVRTAAAGDDEELVEFPIRPEAVDDVLDALEDAGIDRERYTVVVRAETAWPEQGGESDHEDRISHDELRSRAVGMNPGIVTYYGMTALSAVVATAGLLLDSPAIVVGSMVIAPQVGAALTASVGTALDERTLVREGFRDQIIGLLVAVFGAFAFGAGLRYGGFVPPTLDVTTIQQIGQRISPGLLSLAVGLCAGGAGAVGLATALPVSLVGVMVAAALIPAAAAIGIGVAWGVPSVALGAGILLLVNAASINLVAVLVLWALGFRPPAWDDAAGVVAGARAAWPTIAVMAVLLAAFAVTGVVTVQQVQVDKRVNDAVTDTLDAETYRQLELLSIQTRFSSVRVGGVDRTIRVTVARPADEPYPDLPRRLNERLEGVLGADVTVDVVYQDQRTYPTD